MRPWPLTPSLAVSLTLSLALALASPAALARCEGGVPPPHGGESRDGNGLAWYSQPVCPRAAFGAGGVTLDAQARDDLARWLDGARRLYRTDCVAALYGPEPLDHEAARLAYLRWWLGLQQVVLQPRPADRYGAGGPAPARGGDVIELQIMRCR